MNRDVEFWKRVLFTDESKFNVFQSDGKPKVWRKPNTSLDKQHLQPTVKYDGGLVMVWDCFSYNGVGKLHFIDGIMDQHKYIDILKQNLKDSVTKLGIENNFIFYQDNHPKHKAYLTRQWLLYHCPTVMETAPQSPDMNPIENLWAELKNNIKKYSISNKAELKRVLAKEWTKITPATTNKLVLSMPRRLKEVIRGLPTKY